VKANNLPASPQGLQFRDDEWCVQGAAKPAREMNGKCIQAIDLIVIYLIYHVVSVSGVEKELAEINYDQ
jgi:hypothetical protein